MLFQLSYAPMGVKLCSGDLSVAFVLSCAERSRGKQKAHRWPARAYGGLVFNESHLVT